MNRCPESSHRSRRGVTLIELKVAFFAVGFLVAFSVPTGRHAANKPPARDLKKPIGINGDDEPGPREVEVFLPTITLKDDGTISVKGEPETYEAVRGDQLNVSGVIHEPGAKHPYGVIVQIVHYQPDGKYIIYNSGGMIAIDQGGNRYAFSVPIEVRVSKKLPQLKDFHLHVVYRGDTILERELKVK